MRWYDEQPRITHYGRMARVKRRIAAGFYESNPRVVSHVVERLAEDLGVDFPDEETIAERLQLDAGGWIE